jgi:photosystem II stability/assembly factor-like uncharacterized protein
MKKLLTVFLGLFMLILTSRSQDGFNSVHTKDGSIVIAVGSNSSVFISYNGGSDFGSYPAPGSVKLNSVFALGTKVWIVGEGGAVFTTLNGGITYNSHGIGGNDLNSVHFIDENTGWAVGNGGRIVKSTDGGVSWVPQTAPSADNIRSVKFTSATNGYACGDNGKAIYTVNGGSSWQSYTTGTTMNLLALDINGSTMICTGQDGKIFKYNGSIWTAIDYKMLSKSEVRSVSMVNPSAFYTCGGGGFINISTDAGVTRTYQANPMQGKLSDIYFHNGNLGWAVASNNKAILRTTDGGGTWSFQGGVSVTKTLVRKQNTSGNIGNPFAMHPTNKDGMFILAGSVLRRSLDKGETWVQLASGIAGGNCHSFFVNALDTNLMIASMGSSGGRVIVSTNYGQTWTNSIASINLTSYGMPLEVDPNNPNIVYLAPDNAPLRVSTNWGGTWTLLSGGEAGGTFRSPCDVIVAYDNPNTIIIGDGVTGVGSGKVWKSTNGGMNWTLINTVSGSEIPMMAHSSLDVNLVYHSTWSSGSFWKSTNLATSFTNLNRSGSLWACDIAKDDPTAVAYDQYGTNTFLSLDDGADFLQIPATSSPAAGVLFHDKETLLFQHGSGIDKLVITYNVTPVTGNGQISSEIPSSFGLSQNYPNPFNPTTQIKYDVAKSSNVSIKVYNVLGNEVAKLVSGNLPAGRYSADFNASNLATGIYFYTLEVDGAKIDTKKMILVK